MLDDPATYEMLGRGEVGGVFQLDGSPGMRSLLIRFQPRNLGHIAAIIAAYRPALIDSHALESYVRRHRGEEEVPSIHPKVDKILSETYNCMLFQENLMEIANQVGGIPLNETYSLIKFIARKRKDKIDEYKSRFMDGCGRSGLTADQSKELWSVFEAASRYSFNKSHAYSYARLAMQTAYFRCHYPTEFMTALLNSSIPDRNFTTRDRLTETLYDCRKMQIQVNAPSVQTSTAKFTSSYGAINFGLQAIKGVSLAAAKIIESAQPFESFLDFFQRVPTFMCPRSAVRNLIRVGAFDWLGLTRSVLEDAIPRYSKIAAGGYKTQRGIDKALALKPVPADLNWLSHERELSGIYITNHPYNSHPEISRYCIAAPTTINQVQPGSFVSIGGLVTYPRRGTSKRGHEYIAFDLESPSAYCNCILWDNLDKYSQILEDGTVVVVRGEVRSDGHTATVTARKILLPSQIDWRRALLIEAPNDSSTLREVRRVISAAPGDEEVYFRISGHNFGPEGRVRVDKLLLERVRELNCTTMFMEIR